MNGKEISQVEVQHLDVFTIGDRSFRFEFPSPVQKQAKEKSPKVKLQSFFLPFVAKKLILDTIFIQYSHSNKLFSTSTAVLVYILVSVDGCQEWGLMHSWVVGKCHP